MNEQEAQSPWVRRIAWLVYWPLVLIMFPFYLLQRIWIGWRLRRMARGLQIRREQEAILFQQLASYPPAERDRIIKEIEDDCRAAGIPPPVGLETVKYSKN